MTLSQKHTKILLKASRWLEYTAVSGGPPLPFSVPKKYIFFLCIFSAVEACHRGRIKGLEEYLAGCWPAGTWTWRWSRSCDYDWGRLGQAMANGVLGQHNTSDCSVGSGVLYGRTYPLPSPPPNRLTAALRPCFFRSPMTGQSVSRATGAVPG